MAKNYPKCATDAKRICPMTPAGPLARCFAALCAVAAFAGQFAFVALVLALGLDLGPLPVQPMAAEAWLVDAGWLAAFAVQHSGMARRAFKNVWTRLVPDYLERAVYVATSGVVLFGLCWCWQPLPGEPLWRLPVALEAGALLGGLGIVLVAWHFDGLGLIGIRQVREHGCEPKSERLLIVGPYRWVRHPLMACLIVFLWCHPVMPPALAFLSGGLTVYILLALILEERDLRARFGIAYLVYRQRVPLLLPWRRPVNASVHFEVRA
jgi:protein-S-isoprenylcysteine O-methyltransferase Ste14